MLIVNANEQWTLNLHVNLSVYDQVVSTLATTVERRCKVTARNG